MSALQNFVKGSRNGRPGSPQNGQPVNRQAIAANARVQMKPGVARPPTAQGLHARGESVAQHQSASLQPQHLQRRPSGEGRKRDPWETDAESSIDTTVNQSGVEVENSPQVDQQLLQPDNEESETGGDEEASGEDEFDEEEEPEIDETLNEYLAQHNMAHASHEERMRFLQETQPQLFRTIDGDSYPTTTDGNPTELDEQQEPLFEDLGSPSPSPQRLPQHGTNAPLFNQQPLQRNSASDVPHANTAMPQNSKLWRQGAQIRGQQRTDGAVHVRGQSGQQHKTALPPTSRPATYSQVSREQGLAAPPTAHPRPEVVIQGDSGGLPQRSSRLPTGPRRIQNPVPKITEPAAISKHASTARAKVVPIVQQHVEPAPIEEPPTLPDGDYNPDVLFKMDYDQLRDESFDRNPHEADPVLPEDMRDKSLDERLLFAQHKLDPAAQFEFFSALPTNEWEDAGDWFLDQFSAIIKRTREARQKKRKAARDFEQQIEERHKHVAKKQRLVEGAMAKMKAQGEGLVPKSPRASKSPRPRRG
ncbi:hypothetical protein BU25DRAFT_173716 [Macroventuria anomochaeta]|uniref:Uncharacterized protein n=1 Tax=Macroventuria anomochaeta TaxID=301207 RepID=A0ACB6RS38_9PLEO|nr:uncharacterized protein BU25DRAFT_173716 [Macroventuria anomochaeta]KAF2623737.1 hypothetical protein BU25DRAFT_173716 [Macroventuria anomochaeta]